MSGDDPLCDKWEGLEYAPTSEELSQVWSCWFCKRSDSGKTVGPCLLHTHKHTHTVPPCHNLIKEKLLQLVAAWNLLLLVDGYYRGCIYKCMWRSNCLCVLQNEYCGGWPPCSSLRRWIMEEEGQQLHIRSALGSLIVATICALDSVALASAAVSTTPPMVATWCNLRTATFFHPFCLLHHHQHHLLAACWHLFWIG